jgi:hypothetical protein
VATPTLAPAVAPVAGVDARVSRDADALGARFAQAQPFRHVVVDGFFDAGFAQALLAQFPGFERGNSVSEDGRPGDKSTFERIRQLGDAYAALDDLVRGPDFLRLVGRITGIDGLMYDPWYLGGGTHDNRHGSGLEAHVDFNFHPLEGWHRRLNLIVYLNPQWEPGWGGQLQLHRDPASGAPADASINPLFNRCVIFETHDRSWHGFDPIHLPPEHRALSRRSIALYFYTRADAADAPAAAHSTVYVSQPLPARLAAGHTLTAGDVAALQGLLAERDARIRFQYGEISKLMTLLKSHEKGLAGYLAFMARKVYARLTLLRQRQ